MEHVSPKTCTWTKWFGLLLWPRLLHFPGLSITILLFLPLLVFKSLIWTGLRPFTFQVPQHLHSENTALSFTENHCYFGENLSFLFFLAFLGSRTSKRANLPPPFCSIVTMPSSWRSKSQKLDGFRRSQQQNAPAALLRSTPETSGNAQSDSVTEIMIQSCQFYHVQSNESGEIRETQEMSELAIAAKDNILSWAIHRTRTGSRNASPLVWRMALNRNQVENSEILLEVKHPKVVFVFFQWPSSRRPWCSVAVHPLNIIGPGFLGFLGVRLLGCAPVARLLLIWLKQNLCIIETPQGLRWTNYAINNSEGKKNPTKQRTHSTVRVFMIVSFASLTSGWPPFAALHDQRHEWPTNAMITKKERINLTQDGTNKVHSMATCVSSTLALHKRDFHGQVQFHMLLTLIRKLRSVRFEDHQQASPRASLHVDTHQIWYNIRLCL